MLTTIKRKFKKLCRLPYAAFVVFWQAAKPAKEVLLNNEPVLPYSLKEILDSAKKLDKARKASLKKDLV